MSKIVPGETAGGPCAIMGCSAIGATEVIWPPSGRLVEHGIWYCERHAEEALQRGRGNARLGTRLQAK